MEIEKDINLIKKSNLIYPPNNLETFEMFFLNNFKDNKKIKRIYLPILWTEYYINNNYGKGDISYLQNYLDSLDRTKKYFTIIQYDDCILNDLKDLDIIIFSQGGFGKYEKKCYPIPLNCYIKTNNDKEENKQFLMSFVGSIKNRHIIREELYENLINKNDCFLSENLGYEKFVDILKKSKFSLCPRGYGQTSYRIFESLYFKTIPIYIYDIPHVPFQKEFPFEKYGILIHKENINNIYDIINSISDDEINNMLIYGQEVLNKHYLYEGCLLTIKNILENE
jgi:hypothetical protein